MRLERLCRYAGRAPVATERLSVLAGGRLLYRLKRRWRDGTSHMVFEPLKLIEKLAALVPPPRFNLVRYHGILAPSATSRPLVIPSVPETADPIPHPNCPATKQPDTRNSQTKRGCGPRNYSWAQLMKRVFSVDFLACPRCGARIRILAAIHPPLCAPAHKDGYVAFAFMLRSTPASPCNRGLGKS